MSVELRCRCPVCAKDVAYILPGFIEMHSGPGQVWCPGSKRFVDGPVEEP